MASAAGAEVFPGKTGFAVAGQVCWTKAALTDPLFANVRPKQWIARWHGDSHTPVPGATLLASTDRYSQPAFRLGDSLGFQFHLGWRRQT